MKCYVTPTHGTYFIKIKFIRTGLNTKQQSQYTQLKKSIQNGDLVSVESIIKSQNDNKSKIDMAAEEGSTLLFL